MKIPKKERGMKNKEIWQKIYELNCRLKAQLNSDSRYDTIPKNLDATERSDWRLCTAYIDWVLGTVDRMSYVSDYHGDEVLGVWNEILRVLEFYFDNSNSGVSSSTVKNFDQLLNLLSSIRWKRANKESTCKRHDELSCEIFDRIAENKEARKEA